MQPDSMSAKFDFDIDIEACLLEQVYILEHHTECSML